MSNDKLYKVNGNYLLRKIAGEAVLIPVGSGTEQLNGIITLNETFRFIWEQFKEPHTVQDVVMSARNEYDDEDEKIEKDICRFVEESLQYGFLTEEEENEETMGES